MNCRVIPLYDDFTSVSPKGKAVVDNIIVPHNCLELCSEFGVITPNNLLESYSPACLELLGDQRKMPDHSLLMLNF